jgi:hypothetical protein
VSEEDLLECPLKAVARVRIPSGYEVSPLMQVCSVARAVLIDE